MTNKEVLTALKNDDEYYNGIGKRYLSNSNISTLLKNPLALHEPSEPRPAFLVGGYFHTAILEPDKLKNFKVIESATRNNKVYKEISGGELCLLQHEVDQIQLMVEKVMANNVCKGLIKTGKVDYEIPGIAEIEGEMWKGKADIINHEEKLVIDLKTTGDIDRFQWSASKYNYDSQAFIYSTLFGYEMLFIVIDKETRQIGLFDCSPDFYSRGEDKVRRACDAYELFFQTENFDHKQHLLTKTL